MQGSGSVLSHPHFFKPSREVRLGTSVVGGRGFGVIAGPCSIESYAQFSETAQAVKKAGALALRGGIFKMRTRADTFQGLGGEAYEIVKRVVSETGMPMVSEITDPRQVAALSEVVDAFQVGSRNMHNYELLKELGRQNKPVVLKRGFTAYLDEWIAAAEYISREGNSNIIFCERGIRTFERSTRNTLDLSAVPYIKERSDYPILVDPSHATGVTELVPSMGLAAVAAGADGLLVEVHPEPEHAASDGDQALCFEVFSKMMVSVEKILGALDRPLQKA
jgi:3-deoxy-7-phosphoheptulonate synthase